MKKFTLLAIAALAAAASGQAMAASTTATTFTVSMTVNKTCSVTANNLVFPSANLTQASAVTASSTINVTCTKNTPFNVGLDAGQGTGATVTTRTMKGSASATTLAYALSNVSAGGANWGNTVGTDTVSGNGNGNTAVPLTVYGQVTAAAVQAAVADSYQDTINVTVTY